MRFNSNLTFQLFVFTFLLCNLLFYGIIGSVFQVTPFLLYYTMFFGLLILVFSLRIIYYEAIINPTVYHALALISSVSIVRGLYFIFDNNESEGVLFNYFIAEEFNLINRIYDQRGYLIISAYLFVYCFVYVINKKIIMRDVKKELIKERDSFVIDAVFEKNNFSDDKENENENANEEVNSNENEEVNANEEQKNVEFGSNEDDKKEKIVLNKED